MLKIYEPDVEKDAEARAWQDTLIQSIHPHNCKITVRPCYRGSWRVGYTYSGRFKVTFSWERDTYGNTREKVYYTKQNTEKVYRYYYRNVKKLVQIDTTAKRILSVYRKSGLIPKRVAKRHAIKAEAVHGKNYLRTAVGIGYVGRMMYRYLQRYAKCPSCKNIGFTENMVGYGCNNKSCEKTWNDDFHKWQ